MKYKIMSNFAALVVFAALLSTAALGRNGSLPLSDFNKSSISNWHGLPCKLAESSHNKNQNAISAAFPKWTAGDADNQSVQVNWNNGKGYSICDWSRYAQMVVDVRSDSALPVVMSVELRNNPTQSAKSWQFTLQSGIMNTIKVDTWRVANCGTDLHNVQAVVFSVNKPSKNTVLTFDNFRLNLPPAASFDLTYPNYRAMVFPKVGKVKIEAVVRSNLYGLTKKTLSIETTLSGGSAVISKEQAVKGDINVIEIPTGQMPNGSLKLSIRIRNNKAKATIASQTWRIKKLSPFEVSKLRVYIDERNNTIVDGKPFFPIGWYGNINAKQVAEIAESPFNCYLAYGADVQPKDKMLVFLDTLQKSGMKLLFGLTDINPAAAKPRTWEGITGNNKVTSAIVKAYRNHPALLAWYTNDERPWPMAAAFQKYYNIIADADTGHPCYIVLCENGDYNYFKNTTDIFGSDPYPIPWGSPATICSYLEQSKAAVNNHKPVWWVLQAFAWYQYRTLGANGAIVDNDNLDRGREPSPIELLYGRAPTYEEERCMAYLAIVHGAKGLLYYCYYDMRVLPQYKHMWSEMKKIAAEVKSISPELMSGDDLGEILYSALPKADVHSKVLRYKGHYYLIAVNAGDSSCHVTFDTKSVHIPSGYHVSAMFENSRSCLGYKSGKLTDDFKPYEAHVYDFAGGL